MPNGIGKPGSHRREAWEAAERRVNAERYWEAKRLRDREGHGTEGPVIDGDKSRDDHPLNPSETNHG